MRYFYYSERHKVLSAAAQGAISYFLKDGKPVIYTEQNSLGSSAFPPAECVGEFLEGQEPKRGWVITDQNKFNYWKPTVGPHDLPPITLEQACYVEPQKEALREEAQALYHRY